MEKVNSIVAALDLEADSNAVLTRAIHLASAHAARLIVLYVIEAELLPQTAAQIGVGESELRDRLRRPALATVQGLIIESGRTRRTDAQVDFGSPYDTIIRFAREERADLIVIGSGTSHSLKEKILGSTADRVIRASPSSVLVVRRQGAEPYRRVAVTVDFSSQSAAAVAEACKLFPGATITLVHAVNIPLPFEVAMLRAGTPQAEIQSYRAARADKAREDLSTFAHKTVGADKVATCVLEGDPGPTLVRLSKESHFDLLAMGPHGRSVVSQALLGSVTQRVLREAECDVLVARQRLDG